MRAMHSLQCYFFHFSFLDLKVSKKLFMTILLSLKLKFCGVVVIENWFKLKGYIYI